MGTDLANPFSWSRSRVGCFDECRRKYYLRYYLHWGGWESGAPAERKQAYLLGKMTNLAMLAGSAVHEVLARHFRSLRAGRPVPLDPEEPVRIMRRAWRDNQAEKWRLNPKKHPPLFELYYDRVPPDGKLREIADKARAAVAALSGQDLYGALKSARREDFLWIDTAGGAFSEATRFSVGPWEAISNPDLVVAVGDRALIIDWKTGTPRDQDRLQLAADGLWARERLPGYEALEGCLVYLSRGDSETFDLEDALLEDTRRTVHEDMERMSRCLQDPENNVPLDRSSFPLHNNQRYCNYCQFQEICFPERGAEEYA